MPLSIFEDLLDIEVDTLVQEIPAPGEPWECYPYPVLKPTGQSSVVSMRTVVLENDYVKATVLVDLGGRLLYLHDKRTGIDVLPRVNRISVDPSEEPGTRPTCNDGLFWGFGHPGALSPLDFQIQDEDDRVGLTLFELLPGRPISTTYRYELSEHSADLVVSARSHSRNGQAVLSPLWAFMTNPDEVYTFRDGYYDEARDAGLQFFAREDVLSQVSARGMCAGLVFELSLVDTQQFSIRIRALSGLGHLVAASEAAALGIAGDRVAIQLPSLREAQAHVLTHDGQVLEATLDPSQPGPLQFSLSQDLGKATSIKIEDLEWNSQDEPFASIPSLENLTPGVQQSIWTRFYPSTPTGSNWPTFWSSISPRAQLFYSKAQQALRDGDLDLALDYLQDSLAYDANQVMTWWLLSRVQRLRGDDDEATRLNAHYLSPLEPLLRSEAFFAQPPHKGDDPHPLLQPLKTNPEALMEVACQLLTIHAHEDAARWLTEAMNLRPHAMLALVYADSLLQNSAMDSEAGVWVAQATQMPFEAPFPWRDHELAALDRLIARFPNNEAVKAWHAVSRLELAKRGDVDGVG